jgi:carboxymethylenebutenolidase
VPLAGLKLIHDALDSAEVNFEWHEFNGAHAFARDEGPRHDAAATRLGLSLALELFQRRLTEPAV